MWFNGWKKETTTLISPWNTHINTAQYPHPWTMTSFTERTELKFKGKAVHFLSLESLCEKHLTDFNHNLIYSSFELGRTFFQQRGAAVAVFTVQQHHLAGLSGYELCSLTPVKPCWNSKRLFAEKASTKVLYLPVCSALRWVGIINVYMCRRFSVVRLPNQIKMSHRMCLALC